MSLLIPIVCSNVVHMVALKDDGTLDIAHRDHDLDLEESLVALGAKPSPCVKALHTWESEPLRFVQDYGQVAIDSPEHANALIIALGIDFAWHVTPHISMPFNRNKAETTLKLGHKIIKEALQKEEPDLFLRNNNRLHKKFYNAQTWVGPAAYAYLDKSETQYHLISTVADACVGLEDWDTNESDMARNDALVGIGCVAMGDDFVPDRMQRADDLLSQPPMKQFVDIEDNWQRRRIVKVMTAFMKTGKYPALPWVKS